MLGPQGHFIKPYKQICEVFFSNEKNSRNVSIALKKVLQKYGDAPISLVREATGQLSVVWIEKSMGASVDIVDELNKIEAIFEKANLRNRGIHMAYDACKSFFSILWPMEAMSNFVCFKIT